MVLREKINSDFKEAFKSKDVTRLGVLRMLLAAIKNKEVEKRTKLAKTEPSEKLEELSKLSDDEVVGVASSEIKKRKDSAEQFKNGGRAELAEKEEQEIKILSVYMPEQMSDDEIKKIIVETIEETGVTDIKDIGKLMGVLMPKVKGKADGNIVSKVVREELGK